MTTFGDLPRQIGLCQVPEVQAFANVLRSPGHIFLEVLIVVAYKHPPIENIVEFFLSLQDADKVS
jgi:hypothetical protein